MSIIPPFYRLYGSINNTSVKLRTLIFIPEIEYTEFC